MSNSNGAASSSSSANGVSCRTRPCAACHYQHKKCAPDCILAPYFPGNKQEVFLAAHRLFGVRKIIDLIRELPPDDRETAVDNIICMSQIHMQDPVGGCRRVIHDLQARLYYVEQIYTQLVRPGIQETTRGSIREAQNPMPGINTELSLSLVQHPG